MSYVGIGLHHPKNPINVAGVLRAAECYGAAFVATTGSRYKKSSADVFGSYCNLPLFQVSSLEDIIPYGCSIYTHKKMYESSRNGQCSPI